MATRSWRSWSFGRISHQELMQFTRQLATLLHAGLPVVRAFDVLDEMLKPGFLKTAPKTAASQAAPLDLAGATWSGLKAKPGKTDIPAANDSRWKPVKQPGYVNDQLPEWKEENTALFWYRCEFDAPMTPI